MQATILVLRQHGDQKGYSAIDVVEGIEAIKSPIEGWEPPEKPLKQDARTRAQDNFRRLRKNVPVLQQCAEWIQSTRGRPTPIITSGEQLSALCDHYEGAKRGELRSCDHVGRLHAVHGAG